MRPARVLALAGVCLAFASPAHAGEWTCDRRVDTDRSLRFVGGVEGDEFDRFREGFNACFPRQYQGQRTVDLFSGGGSVSAALAISRALVDAGSGGRPIFTRVSRGSYCISACTYMFLSGRFRDVATGGSLEPHGFSSFSGSRIDEAIEDAMEGETLHWDKIDIQTQRLVLLAQWLPALAKEDDRFGWTVAWVREFLNAPRQKNVGISPAVARAFLRLNPAQRDFIQNADAILAAAMPELERVAALEGFEPLLAESMGRPARQTPRYDEKIYLNWVASEFAAAAREYLRALKDSRKPVIGDEFLAQVLSQQRERADSVRDTVVRQLGPYLLSRGDQVDVAGLVTLMFSTSILYTRPLSREEMCDLNIINRDCAN